MTPDIALPDPEIPYVRRPHNLACIRRAVCAYYDLADADLDAPDRHASVARARHLAMWFAKSLTRMSYPEIGRAFGGRDHTTAMAAVRKIDAQRHTDDEIRDAVTAVAASCAMAAQIVRLRVAPDPPPLTADELDSAAAYDQEVEREMLYLDGVGIPRPRLRVET